MEDHKKMEGSFFHNKGDSVGERGKKERYRLFRNGGLLVQ